MEAGASWRIAERAAVASTNDEARALAEAGDPGRVAVVAQAQTAGRGRQGRSWLSPVGGLYLSALLRPQIPPERAGLLPLAAGVAVSELLESLRASAELRWPNDVFARDRKIAGVLCESRFEPGSEALAWVVVGIGLNVAPVPGLADVGGISLADVVEAPPTPRELARPLLERLDTAFAAATREPERIVASWTRRAATLGKAVVVVSPSGEQSGVAVRVEPTGALVVRTTARSLVVTDSEALRVTY